MVSLGIGALGLLVVGPALFFATPAGTGLGLLVAGVVALAPNSEPTSPVEPALVEVPADGVAAMESVKKAMCACQDLACVSGLQPRLLAATDALAADPGVTAANAERLKTISEEMSVCMRALAEKRR